MVHRSIIVAAFAVVVASGWARAEPAAAVSEAAKAMVGGWEISDAARQRRCAVTFGVEAAPGGFKVALDAGCPTAFPSLEAVVSWALGAKDSVRLVDAKGAAVVEFNEVESGMFESERGAEGLLFLQTQAALKVETRNPEQVFGDWQLLREVGKPLCRLMLSNAPAGDGAYKIVVRPGCNAAIGGMGFATWRLDRDQLVLTGRTGLWRFSESDATIWERVPLSVDPILLMRQ
ncbi:MAG: AprI/Inh family metalloprotease inhibitor [Xanthobacteraceae bacterium]